jgi:hypothetical protein
MNRNERMRLVGGLLLVLLGAWLLAVRIVPSLDDWLNISYSWPVIVIGVGVGLFFLGALLGAPGMAVPACIVGGIGGLLYWQNATGNWSSWSYVWALIPGFVGVGVILNGLLEGTFRSSLREGGWLVLISLVMFFIFGSAFGELGLMGDYWPVLVIALGLWMLVRPFLRKR